MSIVAAQEYQILLSTLVGKLFFAVLIGDRDALEYAAIRAVCACRYYDLADTLPETLDIELLAIVMHTDPCEICGE